MRPIWHLAAASLLTMLAARDAFAVDTTPAPKAQTLACKLESMNFDSYPPSATRKGAEGEVLVDFLVDRHGSPHDIHVLASSPNGALFERASLQLVQSLDCSVPEDSTKPRDPEHRFRVWIFFNLATGATPEAKDLGVDGVFQVTATRIPAGKKDSA